MSDYLRAKNCGSCRLFVTTGADVSQGECHAGPVKLMATMADPRTGAVQFICGWPTVKRESPGCTSHWDLGESSPPQSST